MPEVDARGGCVLVGVNVSEASANRPQLTTGPCVVYCRCGNSLPVMSVSGVEWGGVRRREWGGVRRREWGGVG